MIIPRIGSCIVGYFFGCFLTAEVVARRVAGKGACELGDTGNPGMANIMASLGFNAGRAGWIVTLYAGFGCTLGHDFPFWRRFQGGKGVATTSVGISIYSFPLGLAANIAGMLVVFATKYLCIGGPVIPFAFVLAMLARGDQEAAAISLALTVLSILSHGPAIMGIRKGTTKQTDVLAAIRKKVG